MNRYTLPTIALLTLTAGAAELAAQVETGRYQVAAIVGVQDFAASSALETTVLGGVEAAYYLRSTIAVGFYAQAARPKTDANFYPLVRFPFGEETEYHLVSQRVTSYAAGVHARVSRPLGVLEPYVLGGFGFYAFTLDPEQNRSDEYRSGPGLSFGAGANYALTPAAGVRAEVRDLVFLNYDRDWFNLSDPLFREPRFPHPGGEPPAKQSTIHNLRLSVGFTFVPGAGR